jgi:hypothetical protein
MGSDDEDAIAYRSPAEQRGMEIIGAAVRRRRIALGLSQMDLSRRTGIHQSIISRVERAQRWGLAWRRFARLVAMLDGLDFGPLHGRYGPPPKPPVRIRILELERELIVARAELAAAERMTASARLAAIEEQDQGS